MYICSKLIATHIKYSTGKFYLQTVRAVTGAWWYFNARATAFHAINNKYPLQPWINYRFRSHHYLSSTIQFFTDTYWFDAEYSDLSPCANYTLYLQCRIRFFARFVITTAILRQIFILNWTIQMALFHRKILNSARIYRTGWYLVCLTKYDKETVVHSPVHSQTLNFLQIVLCFVYPCIHPAHTTPICLYEATAISICTIYWALYWFV